VFASANAITQFLYKCYARLQPVAIYGIYSDAPHICCACVLLHCVVLASLSFVAIASTGGPPLQPQALQQPPRGPPPRGPPPGTTKHLDENIVLCLTHVYTNEHTAVLLLIMFPLLICTAKCFYTHCCRCALHCALVCSGLVLTVCLCTHVTFCLCGRTQLKNCCRHVTINGFTSGCTRTSPS
jgi:hypothetical protein